MEGATVVPRSLKTKENKKNFSITNNEIVQNSKSERKKFSFVCIFIGEGGCCVVKKGVSFYTASH
jgi:hypothetical protein